MAGKGGGIDMNELEKLLGDYMKKSDMDDWLKRLEKVEKKAKKAKDMGKKSLKKLGKWKPIWKQMLADIEELKNKKVDQSIFESEIESIKELISQLASSGKDIKMPISTGPS
jgi:DNA repair ATPase RecN